MWGKDVELPYRGFWMKARVTKGSTADGKDSDAYPGNTRLNSPECSNP